jgi:hypothetical protein
MNFDFLNQASSQLNIFLEKKDKFIKDYKFKIESIINEATQCFFLYETTSNYGYNAGIGHYHSVSYHAILYDNAAEELSYIKNKEFNRIWNPDNSFGNFAYPSKLKNEDVNNLIQNQQGIKSLLSLKPSLEELRLITVNTNVVNESSSNQFIQMILETHIIPEARKLASKRFKQKDDGIILKAFRSLFSFFKKNF